MDTSAGGLSGAMTESQELDTMVAMLGPQEAMAAMQRQAAATGSGRGGAGGLGGMPAAGVRFQHQIGGMQAMGPIGLAPAVRGIGEEGLWAGGGPRMSLGEFDDGRVGMEGVEGVGAVGGDKGEAGDKEGWMAKKREDMLEKNRRNQKKFRERQKAKMAGLEHQVHLLSAQVQRLAVEKSSLQNQNDLLSKVLAMKEGQMNVLRHEAKTKDDDSPSGEVGPCPPCSMRAVLGLATVESASTYTAEVVMKMSLDEVCQKYKEYVHNLSELLISVDKPGGNPDAEGEIHKIMAYQGELLAKLVVLKPEHGAMFVGRNFELGRTELPDETEALKSTEGLLRGLELTSSQRKRIVALYHQFQTNMQRIRKNRQHLNKSLQDHLSVAEGEYVPGIGMHKVAKTTVEMDEVMQELKNTVDLERHEYSNLCGAFFAMILSSLQAARTIVRSYPFYPDVMGLTILVVRTSKEEDLDSGSDCTGASS